MSPSPFRVKLWYLVSLRLASAGRPESSRSKEDRSSPSLDKSSSILWLIVYCRDKTTNNLKTATFLHHQNHIDGPLLGNVAS